MTQNEHEHGWKIWFSQKPPVLAYARCIECGKEETCLTKVGTKEGEWIDGNYFHQYDYLLVFTKNNYKYLRKGFTQLNGKDFEKKMIDMEHNPQAGWDLLANKSAYISIYLGIDWLECSAIQDPRFRDIVNEML